MEEKMTKQNKMAAMPVPKLLINMGAPMMLSMISLALYNMVDTFFVSRIPDTSVITEMGDKAVNALTLAYPIQMLIIALGVGIGIGINTNTARNLGRGDREKVSRTAGNALVIAAVIYILMLIFGLFGAGAFIRSQTDSEIIAGLGTSYLKIISICSFGTVGHMCLEKIVMAVGRTTYTMIAQLSGAVVNIVMDPLLIYGYLGLPALGVKGAAIATVLGQCVSFALIILFFFKSPEVDKGLHFMKPDGDVLKMIFVVAGPAILMQLSNPIMNYAMNLILGGISVSAVTAFGVYGRLYYIVQMPIFGLNNASIPSASFNRGAKRFDRVRDIIKYDLIFVTIMMIVFIAILQIFPDQIVGIFSISGESARICITALHIITVGYIFLGANYMLQGICQALGKGVASMIITFIRCLIVLLPAAYLLSLSANASDLVWWAVPIAEFAGIIAAVLFTLNAYRKCIKEQG